MLAFDAQTKGSGNVSLGGDLRSCNISTRLSVSSLGVSSRRVGTLPALVKANSGGVRKPSPRRVKEEM
eukprot:4850489-Amphidinium_carterae.2